MARIAGIDLPREKRVEIGLTYIYGIGRPSATKILAQAGVNPDTRCRDLTDDEVKTPVPRANVRPLRQEAGPLLLPAGSPPLCAAH